MPEDFADTTKQQIRMQYAAMVSEKVIPAFKTLLAFLQDEYLPASRTTDGLSALPDGKAWYDYWIRYYTTTDMTSDEIFRLGMSEVARIRAEMERVKQEMGVHGDLKTFLESLRTDPALTPFTRPEQVLDHFQSIYQRVLPNIPNLFDKTPKTAFEIRRTEAFREASASVEYMQGSVDGSRPGILYVPIPDVRKYNILADEDLFLHEAIPGHHYQISLQQENTSLPEFRRTLWYSAYGEGWALYSESLGKELGLYTDPYQYFGMLSEEMHRAIRLVVNVGLHVKGWTHDQAIQFSLDNEAETRDNIIAEIERYMAIPGQALSYKIGQLKIRELRSNAEKALGDHFDIRHFHDVVLESGCLPLELLEKKVNAWIAQQQGIQAQ